MVRLVSLNIWGGNLGQPLLEFFKAHQNRVDIFCLQEVWDHQNASVEVLQKAPEGTQVDILSRITEVLPGFQVRFSPAQDNAEGLAIFSKRDIPVEKHGEIFVFRSKDSMVGNDGRTLGRNLQYIQFILNGQMYTVCHFHGLWTGEGKLDTPPRIKQSQKIISFLKNVQGSKKILCGDFNLLPNTQSLSILEDGMRNLIKEYGITSTRSHYYTKQSSFADYILVSSDVRVMSFKTLPFNVSDHLPLYIELS